MLRLVVPDLENLCRTYLYHRDQGEHDKADFVVVELLDQCVRRQSGGELGRYYQNLEAHSEGNIDSMFFVRDRTGEDLMHSPPPAGGACARSCGGYQPLPSVSGSGP